MELTTTTLQDLIRGIHRNTGYDFSRYSKASLKRRVLSALEKFGLPSLDALHQRMEIDAEFQEALVEEITVNVTEMFRNPPFFRSIKERVLPVLATYPRLKIWNAGCSSGEEMYSFAILLEEAGLLERSTIYGTDINQKVLDQARDGIYKLSALEEFEAQYRAGGGQGKLSDYYTVKYGRVKMAQRLTDKMVFGLHNLVLDGSFNEFNLLVCRNVLIYFEKELQDRVVRLFCESIPLLGFLALGSKESLKFSTSESSFEIVDQYERIYRRVH